MRLDTNVVKHVTSLCNGTEYSILARVGFADEVGELAENKN